MRINRDSRSPWGHRIWFDDSEFDALMDEERSSAGPDLFTPGKGIDVEAFLLRRFGIDPDFVPLPEGVMGCTEFHPDGAICVRISSELADEAELSDVQRRRLRSTLGHEAGHIIFHRRLHERGHQQELFKANLNASVLCRQVDVTEANSSSDWWEYQANRGMASLLLPRELMCHCTWEAIQHLNESDMVGILASGRAEDLVRALMTVFDTSFQMTFFRLKELGFLPKVPSQLALRS